jgi:RNA ligase (TIGR02306 family)
MSQFGVFIKKIRAIETHPNADALELAVIDGYRSVVKKGQFQAGELVAYIPEGAVVPAWLLKRLNLWDADKGVGKLAGPQGNRVKALKLRGELSQGLCYEVVTDASGAAQMVTGEEPGCFAQVSEGQDVASLLGITKYEPPIPVGLAGEVFNAGRELTVAFDVENWKSFPDILQEGEPVIFTEKIHGTCTVVGVLPLKDAHPEAFGRRKNILVFSKGLGAQGLVFKNNAANANNLYVRSTEKLRQRIDEVLDAGGEELSEPLFFLGETFGPKVQDLPYGKEIGLRIFACVRGYRGNQRYLNWDEVRSVLAETYGFETVPVLYEGPFSVEAMNFHTRGKTTLDAPHIREGIVMIPVQERWQEPLGRVCLKSVSEDYLTRKGGTEFN